jgi:hypothetical protein
LTTVFSLNEYRRADTSPFAITALVQNFASVNMNLSNYLGANMNTLLAFKADEYLAIKAANAQVPWQMHVDATAASPSWTDGSLQTKLQYYHNDYAGNNAWDTSQIYATGTLSVIPEPTTVVLLIGGFFGLFGSMHRQPNRPRGQAAHTVISARRPQTRAAHNTPNRLSSAAHGDNIGRELQVFRPPPVRPR